MVNNLKMIRKNLLRYKYKFLLMKQIVFQKYPSLVIPDSEHLNKALVLSAVRKHWVAASAEDEIFQNKVVDEIIASYVGRDSFSDIIESNLSGIFQSGLYYYSMVVSVSIVWEFKVKLLAARFNIKLGRKKIERIGDKPVLKYRNLEDIIGDIEKFSKRLKLDFTNLRKIRNALLHANFHQLRTEVNNMYPELIDKHRGNVITANTTTGAVRNLSDDMSEEEIVESDILSWFIDTTNSQLLKTVLSSYEHSLSGINQIIGFKSFSFDNRARLFKKLICDGQRLSETEVAEYAEWSSKSMLGVRTDQNYFDSIYKYIDLNQAQP